MMARLVNATTGVVVSVPDEDVDFLATYGYRPEGASDVPEGAGDGPPRGNASRDEWASYADSLGVEYPEDARQKDIRALVATATKPDDADDDEDDEEE